MFYERKDNNDDLDFYKTFFMKSINCLEKQNHQINCPLTFY